MKRSVAFLAVLLLTPKYRVHGPFELQTLKGLGEVSVLVESVDPKAVDIGLSIDQLKADVELRLRQSRIKVTDNARSWVYVRLSTLKMNEEPAWVFHIRLELDQAVHLDRNNLSAVAATWETGGIAIVDENRFVDTVRLNLRDDVDQFVNDYLAANPK